jgi:hypothetical protein
LTAAKLISRFYLLVADHCSLLQKICCVLLLMLPASAGVVLIELLLYKQISQTTT